MPQKLNVTTPANTTASKSKELTDKELEQLLADRLNVRGEWPDDVITPEGMRVPLPPMFRRHTPVVGTETERNVEKLYKIQPELRGRANLISPGYTPSMINSLLRQANTGDSSPTKSDKNARTSAKIFLGEQLPSNILGMTGFNVEDRDIMATDWFGPDHQFGTLAHEFQHLMDAKGRGLNASDNPKDIEKTIQFIKDMDESEARASRTGDIAEEYRLALENQARAKAKK